MVSAETELNKETGFVVCDGAFVALVSWLILEKVSDGNCVTRICTVFKDFRPNYAYTLQIFGPITLR